MPRSPESVRRRLTTAVAVLLLIPAALAQACSVNGTRTGSASGSVAPATTASPQGGNASLDWSPCDDGFQCARLLVPLDYTRPAGPTLSLAIVRKRASDARRRIGSLLVNPGGPGGSAINFVEHDPLPAAVSARFDVVGFDPRGVGRSSPLDCHSHVQEMYDADPTLEDASARSHYLAVSRAFVDECRRKYGAVLPYFGTPDVARDMDRVRAALGEQQLTYVGYSYGTSIGEQYAHLFPGHVRAMVLDGVVDPHLTGLAAAAGQADGFERVLDTFLADCATRTACHLTRSPGAVLDRVIAAAEQRPIPAPGADRPATPGVVQLAVGQGLYSRDLWPDLATAIADAAKGNGSGLVELANQYLDRRPDGSYGNGFEIYFAVNCLDSSWPRQPDAILDAAKLVGARDPRLGEGLVNDYVRCAYWPAPPQPLPELTAPGAPPIVVISTTNDPATPYAGGVAVARRLPGSRLVTNVGDSHTVYGRGKACVDRAVDAYLTRLTLPKQGLRCS